jgi:tRNA threonylcarbamoyladenosine biosynthesis protein TsaE
MGSSRMSSSPSPPAAISLLSPTPAETRRLAVALGRRLAAGDVVALIGPLGSGKTTFAQGLAEGLEVPPDRHVASPTFALVNEHPGRVPFVHADVYRINAPAELDELGLDEAYDRAATALEWADRFPAAVPADHLEITFVREADDTRRLTVRATGPRSGALLAGWSGDAGIPTT